MNDIKQIINENLTVICPWCKSMTGVDRDEEESLRCKICARDISQGDLRDEDRQED